MADEPAFERVNDAATFSASVADRRLEFPDEPAVWFRLKSDGTMDGELRRGTVTGTWTFEDGFWCREFTAGGRASPPDCQVVEIAPNQARFTRDRGNGEAGVYVFE